VVVTTIIFYSEGVEIIQESKALHRLCGQRGAYDSRRANKYLLFIFRTSRNDKLTERVKFTFVF